MQRPKRDKPVGLIGTTWRSGSRWLFFSFRDAYKDILAVHSEAPIDAEWCDPGLNIGWPIFRDLEEYDKTWGPLPLVHVTREPVAVVISALRYGLAESPLAALARWYMTHETLFAARPPYMRLQIEDLWRYPKLLYTISNFFGLPQREDLLWYSKKPIGPSTVEITVPAFEVPQKVQDLAVLLGYEDVPSYVPERKQGHA